MSEYVRTLPIRIQGAALAAAALIWGRFMQEAQWWVFLAFMIFVIIGATFYYLGARSKAKKETSDV